jgi:hypothetical protein
VSEAAVASLYSLIAEKAPAAAEPGETTITRMKETMDGDQETFVDWSPNG